MPGLLAVRPRPRTFTDACRLSLALLAHDQPRVWLRLARSLNSVEYLLAYGVAGGWALLHLAPTAAPLKPHALSSAMIVALGWSAIQTWRLLQVAVQARWHDEHPTEPHQPDRGQPAARGGPPAVRAAVRPDSPLASALPHANLHLAASR